MRSSLTPVTPLRIEKHRLIGADNEPVKYVESPHRSGKLTPRYLVMHYTAGISATSTANWFRNSASKASAHLVIGRAGELIQTVPFNLVAWHAGASAWTDRDTGRRLTSLNRHSIGIELVNVGRLECVPSTGCWRSRRPRREFDEADVLVAIHKHETKECGWLRYTDVQLQLALEVGKLLARTYGLRDVLGHEDIAPKRKFDPGPAFPMDDFRCDVLRAKAIR